MMLKQVLLLVVIVVVMTTVAAQSQITMAVCDPLSCGCPQPNGAGTIVLQKTNGTGMGCICQCGLTAGESCQVDGDCAVGTTCNYPINGMTGSISKICINKCSMMKCPQYQRCDLVNNDPVCSPRIFSCNEDVSSPISASRLNDQQTFVNMCSFVNANAELLIDSLTSILWVQNS